MFILLFFYIALVHGGRSGGRLNAIKTYICKRISLVS